ncbi:MAG: LysR family transcriptional regulator [Bacilli bacterium]|nr:LysR family transcriptional regulator [Bacilli bacterium]
MYKTNVNLNRYKTFYDVAKYGSISKAAQSTFTSQPAISKSIKNLEEELGTQLFYRKKDGVILTPKGEELLYYVEKSYANLVTAERIMVETEDLKRGKLSLGMPSNVGTFYLFDKVIEFHKKYPNIEISVVTGGTKYLLDLLDSHKIDLMFDMAPVNIENNDELTCDKIKSVKYCFAYKTGTSSFDIKKVKKLKDLKDVPLILPIVGTSNRNALDEIFIKNNVSVENVINIHTSEMIESFIKKDLGIGYIIYDVIKNDVINNEISVLDFKEELPSVDIEIVYNKKLLSAAPKRFVEEYINYSIKS